MTLPVADFAVWSLIVGVLLTTMALAGSHLRRLPLSTGMLYLGVGVGLGPLGLSLLTPHPLQHAQLLERAAEVAVLISLFAVGLKLGMPLSDKRWHLPLRLASASMIVTICCVTLLGVTVLSLPLGAAILLGAITAPTDPVLASDVQVVEASDRDRLRFSLSAEGGLNDGAAFPFVMLGLGVLGLHDLGPAGWRWLGVDVVWAILGGLAIGASLGLLIGRLVLYLRTRHRLSVGLDEFLALGLIALAYGVALLCHAYGFLAVLAAGVALQRTHREMRARGAAEKPPQSTITSADDAETIATDTRFAGAYLMQEVRDFNDQLERIAEVAVVLVVGAMLAYVRVDWLTVVFVLLVLLVIRPLSVSLGLLGASVSRDQRWLMGWFGIRGIGSIYYLMHAINHGLHPEIAWPLVHLTLALVATSVVLHGISVTPLMELYARRKALYRPMHRRGRSDSDTPNG
jgi:NhaP-type Na+/H+ or K+/H+ antiporter